MSSALTEYFDALERLKAGKPLKVAKGIRINNDSVSLEAGRNKGSIKASREVFADLIKAIDDAGKVQSQTADTDKAKLEKERTTNAQYRDQLDAALAREVSLLHEVYTLKKQLAALTGATVIPIRRAVEESSKNGQET